MLNKRTLAAQITQGENPMIKQANDVATKPFQEFRTGKNLKEKGHGTDA